MFAAGNFVDYAYDSIGQLKTALGKEPGGVTNRLQEQLGYAYDAAGNLNYRTNNGFLQTFNVNSLNELTTASRSGTFTVAGATTGGATNVTINTSNAVLYLDSTFARTNHSLTTTFKTYTAVAQDSYGRTETNSVTAFNPLGPVFEYDLNGNLLFERSAIGVTNRLFAYDDENQLITVWITNAWKSEFVYDGTRRCRIEKNFAWRSSAWVQTNEVRFIYDGNVPIQHRDGNNLPVQTLTRGRDLSGSLQGAGGIGGLLALTENPAVNPEHNFYHSDGNGNVTALINTNQLASARYGYDPFGNTLSISGSKAFVNRYRFSSKPIHEPSGLVYFLYRFYDPSLQRWPNRDPIGELGGLNLYGYAYNDPVSNVDTDGLSVIGKVIPKVIKLIKGRRAVKATSVDDAVRLYKEGESFVMCPTKDAAKEAAKKAGKGSPPIHEIDKKTGSPHYHPNDRSGHFLYGLAGALTFSHYAVEGNPYSETAGGWLDLINPLSIGQDILDIKDAIFE